LAGGASRADGEPLYFHRGPTYLAVLLPRAADPPADAAVAAADARVDLGAPREAGEAGAPLTLIVDYAGRAIDKESGGYYTLHTVDGWYPHAGSLDRALYTATFHWPRAVALAASGRHLDGGTAPDGSLWERRGIDAPAAGFTFEVGKLRPRTVQAGHVRITMAYDTGSSYRLADDAREELESTVAGALAFYEAAFGPYPLDELTVAVVPDDVLAATPGLVVLSDFMVWSGRGEFQLPVLSDWRATVAREMARQWWGAAVGGASYRDQWLIAALATFSAKLYARAGAAGPNPIDSTTSHWRAAVRQTLSNGRHIESAGPMVLGSRLLSSLSSAAYPALVYDKGAVVFDTVATVIGPDLLPVALRRTFQHHVRRTLSTEELLADIRAFTARDLSTLAAEMVYGTELRTIFYNDRFEPDPAGGGRVIGTLRQELAPQYRYRIVRRDGGRFDVARTAATPETKAAVDLTVPADIQVYDPHHPPVGATGDANFSVHGRFLVHGESTDYSIHVGGEPKAFLVDPRGEVFAHFASEDSTPRRALLRSARIAFAQGKLEDADALFDKALATAPRDEVPDADNWNDRRFARRQLTAEIQLGRARLFLEQGRDDEAEKALGQADVPWDADAEQLERDILRSWLDVRRGRFPSAYRRLDRDDLDSSAGTLLFAIAAKATGHLKTLDHALRAARSRGDDVSLLADSDPVGAKPRAP
jgi:tetratricopeptide (TPR) repeat protein